MALLTTGGPPRPRRLDARTSVARLAAEAAVRTEPSLYGGLAGDASGLRLLAPGREAVALDRLAAAAARTMGDALAEGALRDQDGARWRFVEYRKDPPLLPPGTSWMQGAAGIAAFLFRLARVMDDGRDAQVVDRPDEWWAVPARLRTVHG
jgi:hypothetical protein